MLVRSQKSECIRAVGAFQVAERSGPECFQFRLLSSGSYNTSIEMAARVDVERRVGLRKQG
jgi:hypothetical protein